MVRQLLKKELYLQRSSLAFALVVTLISAALIGLAPRGAVVLLPNLLTMGQLVSLMQSLFVGPCLLGVAPLLIGAAMVAEERKLGVWEWGLSLPASRLLQWTLKLALGAGIALLLTLVIQPGLDRAMDAALGGRGQPIALPTSCLHFNKGYLAMPLLLMAASAFVSSVSSDPYRAFFGGLAVFAVALACTRLADPAGMLLAPWGHYLSHPRFPPALADSDHSPFLFAGAVSLALVVVLSAILAGLAWFNFRYEGFRWRRFICELSAMVVLIVGAAALALRWEFSPMGLIGRRIKDVEPLIVSGRQKMGFNPPTVDWTGIRPLLVKKARPGFLVSFKRAMSFLTGPPFGPIYRAPKEGRILAEVNSFPVRFATNEPFGWRQIVEIDMATGGLRPIYQLMGSVNQVFPEHSGYVVADAFNRLFLVADWPVPIRIGGFLWPLWSNETRAVLGFPSLDPTVAACLPAGREIPVGAERVHFEAIFPLYSSRGAYWQLYLKREPGYETWLIRRLPEGAWSFVDKQTGLANYTASGDGKWFARRLRIDGAYRMGAGESLQVFAADHSTSWTVNRQGGNLMLCPGGNELSRRTALSAKILGTGDQRPLPVSPSGRFLPFLRTRTMALDEEGKSKDTGYPEKLEFGALDLQTGREIVLLQAPPEREVQGWWLTSEMQAWCREQELEESSASPAPGQTAHPPTFCQDFPPTVWAPDRDKLAILYSGRIHLFEYLPERAEKWRGEVKSGENMGGFLPVGMIDLYGFEMNNLDFWDDDTLLAWGNLGLFEIQLPIAVQQGQLPPASSKSSAPG